MNLSQNHFVPQFIPHQMVNTALQYNGPSSFVGKVIRIRPNIYVFVCDYCMSEHQSIDDFLHHTELHFQRDEISNAIPSTMTHAGPNQYPTGTAINSNGSAAAPYPVQLQQSQFTPTNQQSNFTDEVYEIIDLGYDFEGNYPSAKKIDAIPIDGNDAQRSKPKKQRSTAKVQRAKVQRTKPKILIGSTNENTSKKCPFCIRNLATGPSMKRHLDRAHAKIFKKILCQKKAFKCKICERKFPKTEHTLEDAHEHLKMHYNN